MAIIDIVIFVTQYCLPELDEGSVEDTDFTSKEDIFGCVNILGDLVPKELHFYPQAEDKSFSLYLPPLGCTFYALYISKHLVILSLPSVCLLTALQRGN